jgi:UDP-2-acetamido-2,6-beta-L-arabino-hexul-4-ose reductase
LELSDVAGHFPKIPQCAGNRHILGRNEPPTTELVGSAGVRYSPRSGNRAFVPIPNYVQGRKQARGRWHPRSRKEAGRMSANKFTVGITGANGFVGSHLLRRLGLDPTMRLVCCPRESLAQADSLRTFAGECNTIVHLAAMNRGDDRQIFGTNVAIVDNLIEAMSASARPPHFIFASSTQRDQSTEYGRSKKACETHLREWAKRTGASLTILVIPNVFGPGCRPYYNSAVATFCHQLAHDQEPVVIDDQQLSLVWINDLVEAFSQIVLERRPGTHEARVAGMAEVSVSQLLAKLQAMSDGYFKDNMVPNLSDPLDASLYTTFLSHVELDDHRHQPQLHSDARGQLFEILRFASGGQIFFSTTKPGVIRGNHFHSRKVEWFCVVRGEAVIRIRRVGDGHVREFRVSGEKPEFISIPALHTHQIENVGKEDLLTMFWCNEIFQPGDPDTFHEQVA